MSQEQVLQLLLVFGSLVLVTAGLAGHRPSWSKGVRLTAIWLGIFLVVTLFISVVAGA